MEARGRANVGTEAAVAMRDAAELLSVHFCSLIASFSLLLYHLLAPGGLLGSPRLAFSLVSLATSLGALLAPFLFLCPVELRFSPVKPFRHYLANAGLLTPQQQQQHSRTKRRRVPDAVSPTAATALLLRVCVWCVCVWVIN